MRKMAKNASIYWANFLVTILSVVTGKVVDNQQPYPQYREYYGTDSNSGTNQIRPELTVWKSEPASNVGGPQLQDPLVSQSTSVNQPQAIPNQHVYYYETFPTPVVGHSNYKTNPVNVHDGSKGCGYGIKCHSRQDYGVPYYNDYDVVDDKGTGAGLGGLIGLIGLLGLKGLKGLLSVLIPIITFPLFLPLMIPVILPLLLVLAIPLLLIPIPVISVPAPTARNLQLDLSEARKMATGLLQTVISSDQCIERIACEVAKRSKQGRADKLIQEVLNYLPQNNPFTTRLFKGYEIINGTSSGSHEKSFGITKFDKLDNSLCHQLNCKIFSFAEAMDKKLS